MFDPDRPSIVEEYEYSEKTYHSETGDVYAVYVSAVGGGTEGVEYTANYWHVRIVHVDSQETVVETSDLYTPHAYHWQAAKAAMEFYEA